MIGLTSTPRPIEALWLCLHDGFLHPHTGERLPDDFLGIAWTQSGIFHTGLEKTETGSIERFWTFIRSH